METKSDIKRDSSHKSFLENPVDIWNKEFYDCNDEDELKNLKTLVLSSFVNNFQILKVKARH